MKKLITITLPKRDNDGKPFHDKFKLVEGKLMHIFGGFSAHNVYGGWMNPEGRKYFEANTKYEVVTKMFDLEVHTILSALKLELEHRFQQEEIFITVSAITVI